MTRPGAHRDDLARVFDVRSLDHHIVESQARSRRRAENCRSRARRPDPTPQAEEVHPLEEAVPSRLEPSLPVQLDVLEEATQQQLEVGRRVLHRVKRVGGAVGGALRTRGGEKSGSILVQHARDLAEHRFAIGHVLDRLEDADRVEGRGGELEGGQVHDGELDVGGRVARPCVRDRPRIDVDSDDAARERSESRRPVTRTAGSIQYVACATPRLGKAVPLQMQGDDARIRLVGDDALGVAQAVTILARALSAAPSPRPLDRVVPWLAGATVVAFAAGSSSVGAVKDAGLDARWLVLAALAAAAVRWAQELRRLPTAVLVAAAGFVALALVSSLWSVAPRLSAGRGISLALLFSAAALIAAGVSSSPANGERVLAGLLGGAVLVALFGVVVLAASYSTAVAAASIEAPPRFRGFGENPNTVPLLLALAFPLALQWAMTAPGRLLRLAAAAAVVLFWATLVASGSRGALLAAATGVALTLALSLRGRRLLAAGGAVALAVVVAAVLQSLPDEASSGSPATPPAAATAQPAAGYVDFERSYPLGGEIGRSLSGGREAPVKRSFLGSSGRVAAWQGAAGRIAERPLLGFGFGTESKAFVDRYHGFAGGVPENSYIGAALQLGVVGLAALLALLAVLALTGRSALGKCRQTTAACAGVVAAGLAIGVVQSYFYSVGNIGTATLWVAAFLLPALAVSERR